MTLNALSLTVSNVWNYNKLALFICQLFSDGSFRSGHIIYHSDVFIDQFTSQIDSVCPHSIPWKITDIELSSLSPFKNPIDTNDNILQVIFLNPRLLDRDIEKCMNNALIKYYRIFVLPSTDEIETKNQFSIIKMYNLDFNMSVLIVYYDSVSGELSIICMPMNAFDEGEWRPIPFDIDPEENMFDRTFGEYERNRSIAINILLRKV